MGSGRRAGWVITAMAATMTLGAAAAAAVGGGSAAVPDGTYTFVAKIDTEGRSCSGALVAEQWVVTAKTCFPEVSAPGAPAAPAKATVGRTSLSSTAGQVVDVVQVIPRDDRNVALVKLAQPVTGITPAALRQSPPAAGAVLKIAGYGRTATEWVPDRLHAGNFTVLSVADKTLAVESPEPEKSSLCKGDGGGPAFDEFGSLYGVTSAAWTGGCFGETETRRGGTEARTDDIAGWFSGLMTDPRVRAQAKANVVSWSVKGGFSLQGFQVYGSATDPSVPLVPANLLANAGRQVSFTHNGVQAGQTWYYRVAVLDLGGQLAGASLPVTGGASGAMRTDFNGDRKEDIATFVRGGAADVYVSRSTGTKFVEDATLWHDFFAAGSEYPLSGDFNGDGLADIVTFLRGSAGDVYVSLSDGTKFGPGQLWHNDFGYNAELPVVGDFNGDGKDDIAVFTRGAAADVYVALSDGTKFVGAGAKWHEFFAANNEIPMAGDFNGDGKDDIVTFVQGGSADVYVAFSTGSSFGAGQKWNDFFAPNAEVPGVGDFNGDGKDDIVTFLRGSTPHVYVDLSDGTKFVAQPVWNTSFADGDAIPGVGDFNGDGKDDVVAFKRGSGGDVFVSTSTGSSFQGNTLWHGFFAPNGEVPVPRVIPLG